MDGMNPEILAPITPGAPTVQDYKRYQQYVMAQQENGLPAMSFEEWRAAQDGMRPQPQGMRP